jgi:hypothetical protein
VAYRGESAGKGERNGDMGLFGVGTSSDVRGEGEVAVSTVFREERDSLGDFGEFGPRMADGSSTTSSLTTCEV